MAAVAAVVVAAAAAAAVVAAAAAAAALLQRTDMTIFSDVWFPVWHCPSKFTTVRIA